MKKTLNNIFDEANANELENLVCRNAAPDVSADTLSSVKDKVYAKTGITRSKIKKPIAFRWRSYAAVAACFLIILSAVIVAPMLRGSGNLGDSEDAPIINTDPPKIDLPSISTIKGGYGITGKQELVYGDPSSGDEENAEMIAPGFYIKTVIQGNVIEVLPDYYYRPDSSTRYLVARVSVEESIRGNGLPQEILVRFPYYTADIFDGYDTFIFSLQQVGVENYMMINDTKREVAFFSHMFEPEMVNDLGYGSVIAFTGGKVDTGFFDRANHSDIGGYIASILQDPSSYLYPVGYDTTLDEAKTNIKELSQKSSEESMYVRDLPYDYLTADDIFISDEGKSVKSYLEPSEMSVFMQEIYPREDRIIAVYTRVINGFVTEEQITINGYTGENGNVSQGATGYNENDLTIIPNIGEALENIDLSELKPPHIEVIDGMHFKYAKARGVYRKVDGKIYGIIRVVWSYTFPKYTNGYVSDDCYYLYDQNGNGSIVERDELKAIIGDDNFILRFSYDSIIAMD